MRVIRDLHWRADRIDHIARHLVAPEEVVEAIFDDPGGILLRVGPAERNPAETLYRYLGRTVSGRYLLIVLIYLGEGLAMPVAARDMTRGERSRFNERHPKDR